MGIDIHAYIETKSKKDDIDGNWGYLGDYKFSRNYALFALMASVRRYLDYPNPEMLNEALAKRGSTRLDDPNLSKDEGELIMREGCDSGVTRGVPSFEEKGIPKNISWRTAEEYTLIVVPDDDKIEEEETTCTLTQANSWISLGSSDVWDVAADGSPLRITHPDVYSASWLDAKEVRTLADRFREMLLTTVDEAQKAQATSIAWASDGLATAKRDNDVNQIAFFERELERESDWGEFNPLSEFAYIATEALAAQMATLDAHGINARVVFWFDS